MNQSESASFGRSVGAVARFHAPLVVQAALLAAAGPLLQHALARAADPSRQIAGFWLAFSLAGLLQAGVLAVQQAALAGRRRGVAEARLALGAAAVAAATSAALLGLGLLALFEPRALGGCGIGIALAGTAGRVLLVLAGAPPFLAGRGFAAGRLVAAGRSAPLAWAGLVRLVTLAVACSPVVLPAGDEAVGAARAVLVASVAECAVVAVFASRVPRSPAVAPERRGWRRVALPVVASLLAWSAVRPLVHSVLGGLAHPLAAQAAFGAVMPALMLVGAPLWALFDVTLALPRGRSALRAVRAWGCCCAAAATACFTVACWPPAGAWLLGRVMGVPGSLVPVVAAAVPWLALLPPILVVRAIGNAWLLRRGGFDRTLALAPARLALVAIAGWTVTRLAPATNGAALGVAMVVAGDALDAALVLMLATRASTHAHAGDPVPEDWRQAA